jgi:hypothetical protein
MMPSKLKLYLLLIKKYNSEILVLEKKSKFIREQVENLQSIYESKRSILESNDTFTQLSALEVKLKQHEATTFALRDCI